MKDFRAYLNPAELARVQELDTDLAALKRIRAALHRERARFTRRGYSRAAGEHMAARRAFEPHDGRVVV